MPHLRPRLATLPVQWPRLLWPALLAALALLLTACAAPRPAAPGTAALPPTASPPQVTAPPPSTPPPPTIACTSVRRPAPTGQATPPYLRPNDLVDGPADAPVIFVMYGDYQDPGSAAMNALLLRLRRAYPQTVRRVFRPYPLLKRYDKALLALRAALAAGRQGAFWAFHDRLFADQSHWAGLDEAAFRAYLAQSAAALGLDAERFRRDLDDPTVQAQALAAREHAQRIGIPGVPLLYLNGEHYPGPWDWGSLDRAVRLQALSARQFAQCPPLLAPAEAPAFATLRTTAGDIVLQLYPDQAPMAVSSFLFLARHGWYDGNPFFEVRPGVWARTGDPSATGLGQPGYTFAREIAPDLTFDRPGRVALYSEGPRDNGSQFFITLAALPDLNGRYTLFGQVVDGLDIVRSLPPREVDHSAPPPLVIQKVDLSTP